MARKLSDVMNDEYRQLLEPSPGLRFSLLKRIVIFVFLLSDVPYFAAYGKTRVPGTFILSVHLHTTRSPVFETQISQRSFDVNR